MAHRQSVLQEVVMSHRRSMSIAGALVIVALALPAASAYARLIDPINSPGTEVATPDDQGQTPVVNAPGTDVAAPDQQAPSPVVNARGTDVAAPDQQAPSPGADPAPQPADPFAADGGSPDTFAVVALVVLAIGCIASWLALSRKRSRATV
jgi:hypothetical protein